MWRVRILDRCAKPLECRAEILLALTVEAFLMRTEARDAGADFARHIAWRKRANGGRRSRTFGDPDRLDRRSWPWCRLEGEVQFLQRRQFSGWNRREAAVQVVGFFLPASHRLHATNNFPEFTGWICPAPCEPACVLALNTDPVTIKQIEVSIVERAFDDGDLVPAPPSGRTGKRVAVVGSGAAGLAAAQQLTRAGHEVTVFERDDRIGGLLRYGIPDFKMPKDIIDRRLEQMIAEGTAFRPSTDIRPDDVPILRRDHDAIILAVGGLDLR